MKLRLFSRGLSFIKQMPRRKLAVSVLVLFAAIGGVFLVTRQIFKADTPHTESTASVSYLDSTGNPAEVTSNTVSLNITAPTDPKIQIETKMVEVLRIANACQTYAGFAKVYPASASIFRNELASPFKVTDLTAGTSPICDTSALNGSQKTETTGNYPTLPEGYLYNLGNLTKPTVDGIIVAVRKPGSSDKYNCTLSGCTKIGEW